MDYKIENLGLASWGIKEIQLAETEISGLMSLRKKCGAEKPLKAAKITGSLHMTSKQLS